MNPRATIFVKIGFQKHKKIITALTSLELRMNRFDREVLAPLQQHQSTGPPALVF